MLRALLLAAALIGSASCAPDGGLIDGDRTAPTPTATVRLGDELRGWVRWGADVTDGQLTEDLAIRASGVDSSNRFHSLSGTLVLSERGSWGNGALRLEYEADLAHASAFGVVRYDTHLRGELESTRELTPVEFDLSVSDQGTRIDGTVRLHPRTNTLFTVGRDRASEEVLSITGLLHKSCTVTVSQPAPAGTPAPLVIVAGSHPLCDTRFSGD